jgi:hypothetical protein
MGRIKIKPGVEFKVIAPAGMRILEVLKSIVKSYTFDVTITSGTDGIHSGPADPHYLGMAYDIRTHDLKPEQKQLLLMDLQKTLGPEFTMFIESPNTNLEHLHCQRKYGTTFTIEEYFN